MTPPAPGHSQTTEARNVAYAGDTPGRSGPSPVQRAHDIMRASTRLMLLNPSRVATIFWAGGCVAVLSVLPLERWSRHAFLALVIIAALCASACALRSVAGRRLPLWTLHVDVALATVLVSSAAAIGVAGHVDFADIYIWVALFAALHFRPLAMFVHVAGAGAAYALVLAFGPTVADPVAAWLAIFGTVAVAAAVALGLVSALRRAAREDPLTGLANRRSWDERLDEELERARRNGQALSLVMLDLDGFKAVNDRSGHEAGDRLLQELAHHWQAAVRGGGDFLARLGGDEFALLAPGADAFTVRRLARRLGDVLPQGVMVSSGVATWDETENASDLLHRADLAMYQTKQRHRRRDGLRHA